MLVACASGWCWNHTLAAAAMPDGWERSATAGLTFRTSVRCRRPSRSACEDGGGGNRRLREVDLFCGVAVLVVVVVVVSTKLGLHHRYEHSYEHVQALRSESRGGEVDGAWLARSIPRTCRRASSE